MLFQVLVLVLVVVVVVVDDVVVVVVVVVVVPGCCCSRSHILDQKHQKSTVFSNMFMPLEEKTLVFALFLQRQGRKSSKNIAIYTVF